MVIPIKVNNKLTINNMILDATSGIFHILFKIKL